MVTSGELAAVSVAKDDEACVWWECEDEEGMVLVGEEGVLSSMSAGGVCGRAGWECLGGLIRVDVVAGMI